MPNEFDLFAKEFCKQVLGDIRSISPAFKIEPPTTLEIDLISEPLPGVDTNRAFAELGWLARMTASPCLLEPYSTSPDLPDVRACIQKQLAWDSARRRESNRAGGPAPMFPLLWILSVGDPKTVTRDYALAPRKGWPRGFRFAPPGIALCVVVLTELERKRETLLLRLLGRRQTLVDAIEDAREMEPLMLRRSILDLLVRRGFTVVDSTDEHEKEAAMISKQEFQKIKKEIHDEGRREGRDEARRDLLRRLLATKFGPLDNAVLAHLDAASDAMLDTYADRILAATRIADVIGD